ncbi:unnamed protein product [Moneuplotes crassus]|uniref:Uncharacterized protein n=1 Tax=Euplotes crassus TaxID=5936 RepID=A0AAD1X614_EUPCR|nr:unnamed protein product [Moneuplotes crassus]
MESPTESLIISEVPFNKTLRRVAYKKPEKLTIDMATMKTEHCDQSVGVVNDTIQSKETTIYQTCSKDQPLSNDIVVQSLRDYPMRVSTKDLSKTIRSPKKVSPKKAKTNQILRFMRSKYSIMSSQEPRGKKIANKSSGSCYNDSFPCIYNHSYSNIPKTHNMRREKPALWNDSPTNFSTDMKFSVDLDSVKSTKKRMSQKECSSNLLNESGRQASGMTHSVGPVMGTNTNKFMSKKEKQKRTILKSSIKNIDGISIKISSHGLSKAKKSKTSKKINKILNTTRRAELHSKSLASKGKKSLQEDQSTEYFRLLSMQRMKGVNILALKNSRKSIAQRIEFSASPKSKLELKVGSFKVNQKIQNPLCKIKRTTSNSMSLRKYSENWVDKNMNLIERNLHCLQIT